MLRHTSLAAILVVLSSRVFAQATPLVPPTARVYRDIERFAAMGLIDTLLLGARPLSEREILRLLNEARRNLSRAASGARLGPGNDRFRSGALQASRESCDRRGGRGVGRDGQSVPRGAE